ncbi:hypothetical protein EMGBS15_11560 [Filimonas sp.]|nr:hypothetical protein EMGBS15_11560 [Filimonas sp.]
MENQKPGNSKPTLVALSGNKTDLKNFYPKGTKDELVYYATQFNSIEFNASFYRLFPPEQYAKWKDLTPKGFKFFPKLGQEISHWGRLKDTENAVDQFIANVSHLEKNWVCLSCR